MLVKNHLFKERVPLMNAALDAYALRQKTISKNIANVNTPGYKPEKVRFEDEFRNQQEALKGINNHNFHLPLGDKTLANIEIDTYKAKIPEGEIYMSGDNSVNIDREMSDLAQNQIRARFASQMLSRYFKGLSSSITGQQNQ